MKLTRSIFKRGRCAYPAWLGMTIILAACGEKPQELPQPKTAEQPVKLFQQERSALDKAKTVEQTVGKSADDLEQEIEKQSQ